MATYRRIATIVGVLFIIGTVAGVLSVLQLNPILIDPDYLRKVSENENRVITGALLVLVMGLALAMVSVVMFPIARRHNETLALGYVVFRGGLEPIAYIAMVISQLLLLPLSQEYAKAGASDVFYFQTSGNILLSAQDMISHILIIVFGLGAVMFYVLLYQSKLIPRWLSVWGLVAILLHMSTAFMLIWGLIGEESTIQNVLNLPIFVQEMVMAVWLIIKGFDPQALAFEPVKQL